MKAHLRYFAKGAVFSLILAAVLLCVNRMMVPKYISSDFPTTSAFLGFYEMERDSVDVLFLGSSHVMSAFSPQELYDEYGLRSYNLGSQEQSLLLSYYWLREALRFQRPKAVVLDTFFCFPYLPGEPLNANEATVRRSLDHMRWSSVKREAVEAVCALDPSQSALSYYFPNIRYHERWLNDLGETDFTPSEWSAFYQMKGFALTAERSGKTDFQPFWTGWSRRRVPMEPLMEEYLDKITALCEEEDIALILVKTPTTEGTLPRYNTTAAYAEAHGLRYYDFNELELYEEVGYDFAEDNREWSHVNYWGARKLAGKLAEVLIEECGVPQAEDRQWEESRAFYQGMAENAELTRIKYVRAYLRALPSERYTIFIAGCGAVKNELLTEMQSVGLRRLGLTEDPSRMPRGSYYAVIFPEGVQAEELSMGELSITGSFRDGRSVYSISSAGPATGDSCSIVLDGVEYARNRRGLNIVVFDNVYGRVVDSVNLNVRGEVLTVNR